MTIDAAGGSGSPERMTQAMDAARIGFCLVNMATRAIDRFRCEIVVRMFRRKIGMAGNAVIRFVDCAQESGGIDEQRNCLASGIGFKERLVPMTLKTGAVFYGFGMGQGGGQQQPHYH